MARLTLKPEIRCNFVDCAAGGGVAAKHGCFFGGSWWEPDCPEFIDEQSYMCRFQGDGNNQRGKIPSQNK